MAISVQVVFKVSTAIIVLLVVATEHRLWNPLPIEETHEQQHVAVVLGPDEFC